ncbi:MAG: hypothetical protein ACOY7T_10980 [Pseudomonadota bacterium]
MEDPFTTHAEIQTRVSSATTPVLLLASACLAGGTLLTTFGPAQYQDIAIGLAVGGPILAALQIAFFTFFDRDRLHTERHLERRAIIERMPPAIGDATQVKTIEGNANVLPNSPRESGHV